MMDAVKIVLDVFDLTPVIVTRDHFVDIRDLRGDAAMMAVTEVKQALNAVFGYGGAYTHQNMFTRL